MWPTLSFSQAVRDTVEFVGGGIFVHNSSVRCGHPFSMFVCLYACQKASKPHFENK